MRGQAKPAAEEGAATELPIGVFGMISSVAIMGGVGAEGINKKQCAYLQEDSKEGEAGNRRNKIAVAAALLPLWLSPPLIVLGH